MRCWHHGSVSCWLTRVKTTITTAWNGIPRTDAKSDRVMTMIRHNDTLCFRAWKHWKRDSRVKSWRKTYNRKALGKHEKSKREELDYRENLRATAEGGGSWWSGRDKETDWWTGNDAWSGYWSSQTRPVQEEVTDLGCSVIWRQDERVSEESLSAELKRDTGPKMSIN